MVQADPRFDGRGYASSPDLRNISSMLQTSEQINEAKNKDRYEDTIAILETLVRDIFSLAKGFDQASIANADIAADLGRLRSEATTNTVERWITEIEELQFNYLVNINRKVATDGLFVKMAGA